MPERNEPCPCGSGRKYKNCCLRNARPPVRSSEPSPAHALDERVVIRILEFGMMKFHLDIDRIESSTFPSGDCHQIAAPWIAYCVPVEGRPLAAWYAEARALQLSAMEERWLVAQAASWLSVWEVLSVDPGRGFVLRDLLTGQERDVHEISGSHVARPRLSLMGRIIDFRGETLICGVHPRPMFPDDSAAILREFRDEIREKGTLSIEQLRQFDVASLLVELWEERLELLSRRKPPILENTDGDPLLLTTDMYHFDEARREELLGRLTTIEGAGEPQETAEDVTITVTRPGNRLNKSWDNTIIGTLFCGRSELRVETNSINRAGVLRERVETAAKDLITWRIRDHTDPTSPKAREGISPEPDPESLKMANDPEIQELLRSEKTAHYGAWLDTKLPALAGRTPRKASRTPAGLEEVITLLKSIELSESRSPPEVRFDVRTMYDALGIEYR